MTRWSYATPGEMELFSWHWTSWEDSSRPSYPRPVVINDSQNGQNILRVPVLGPGPDLRFSIILSSGYSGLSLFLHDFRCSGLMSGMLYTVCLVHNSGFICKNMIFLLRQKRLSKRFHFCFFRKCWWPPSTVLWTQNSVFSKNVKMFSKAIYHEETFELL